MGTATGEIAQIEGKDTHCAIPSWSGYVYQGKAAICSVLEILIQDASADRSSFEVELEWFEDFSIKESGKHISIHQVKARKSPSLSAYDAAISNLSKKSKKYSVPAFLHTTVKLDEKIKDPAVESYLYGNGDAFCPLASIDSLVEKHIAKYYQLTAPNLPHKTEADFCRNCRLAIYDLLDVKIRSIHDHESTPDLFVRSV